MIGHPRINNGSKKDEETWVKVFQDYSQIQDFEADLPYTVGLQIMNLAIYTVMASLIYFQNILFLKHS